MLQRIAHEAEEVCYEAEAKAEGLCHEAETKVEAFCGEAETKVEEILVEVGEVVTQVEATEEVDESGKEGIESLRKIKQSLNIDPEEEEMKSDHIVDRAWFTAAVSLLTLMNTIQMGLEADNPDWKDAWLICENVFTAGFALEMVLKIWTFRSHYFRDSANWLDGSLTTLGILDCWILAILSGSGGGVDLQSLSVLRILRLLRLARILKLMRSLRPLVLVIRGVMKAMSTAAYVFALCIFIFYVFAIFVTEHLGKSSNANMYPGFSVDDAVIRKQEYLKNYNPYICFGSMRSSMLTLFNLATLTEWAEIIRPIAYVQPVYLVVFLFFAICVGFGVMNVLIAVIVDVVTTESRKIETDYRDHIKKQKLKTLDKIQVLLADLDENHDGLIDITELQTAMDGNNCNQLLELMGSIDLPRGWASTELMDMLDNNGDGHLQYGEFTTSFFRLLDSDDFQQICIMQASINQVKHMIRDQNRNFQERHSTIEADIASIKEALGITNDSKKSASADMWAHSLIKKSSMPGSDPSEQQDSSGKNRLAAQSKPDEHQSNSGRKQPAVRTPADIDSLIATCKRGGQQSIAEHKELISSTKVAKNTVVNSTSDAQKLAGSVLTSSSELEEALNSAFLLLKESIHEEFADIKASLESHSNRMRAALISHSMVHVADRQSQFSAEPSSGFQHLSVSCLNSDHLHGNQREIAVLKSRDRGSLIQSI